MSYNTKNYTEQGGERTVIGGILEFKEGASLVGGLMENQAASTASTVAALVTEHNALLTHLKDSGLMKTDSWPTISVAKLVAEEGEDHKVEFEGNQALISSVDIEDGVITITADVESMTAYQSAAGFGTHKWIGLLITTGFPSIVGMKFNGTLLTRTDADETTRHSGAAGDLVLYLPADTFDGKSFTLWHSGSGAKELTVSFPED